MGPLAFQFHNNPILPFPIDQQNLGENRPTELGPVDPLVINSAPATPTPSDIDLTKYQ